MNRFNHTYQGKSIAFIGLTSTCLFVLTKLHAPDQIANILALPMVLLGFFAIYRYGKDLDVKVPMLLLLATIIIPLVSWYFADIAYPDYVSETPRLDKLSRIFIFIPIAWWLKDSPKKVFLFWGLAAFSILISPWVGGGGWKEIVSGFHGTRIVFGLRNGQHASLFFGFVLIGLICFGNRLVQWNKWATSFLLLSIAFCLFSIASSLVRASWLGLIITAVSAFFYFLTLDKRESKVNKKYLLGVILFGGIVLGVIYQSMGNIIEKRASSEPSVIKQLMSGDIDNVPYTSIGIRIHMWQASITKIKERPITGWGNNGQSIAIDDTDWMPDFVKENFGHIHNIYIALLTNYGLVGFVFYFFWIGWFLVKIISAVSKGYLKKDVGFFALSAIVFWSVMGMFESYLFFWTGVYCLQVIFGGLLALIWHSQIVENTAKE